MKKNCRLIFSEKTGEKGSEPRLRTLPEKGGADHILYPQGKWVKNDRRPFLATDQEPAGGEAVHRANYVGVRDLPGTGVVGKRAEIPQQRQKKKKKEKNAVRGREIK